MAELKREFYETLKTWKASKGKECLLVKGARQIGKTFIIEKFGRENYESVVSLNPTFHVRVQKGRISWETGCRSSLHFCFLRCGVA